VIRLLFYAAVIYLAVGIRIVKPEEWLIVLRFGKYNGFRKQGIHWVVPFVDKTIRVDLNQVSASWKDTSDEILETKVHKWISTQSSS
jgi:regulator of protease activity HflC (stomatin/prohibitin superfamily)